MTRLLPTRPLLGAVAALLISACSAPAPAPVAPTPVPTAPAYRLRVAVTTTPIPALTSSIIWLAKDLGFYQQEGLDVDVLEVTGSPVAITALQAGDVEVAAIGLIDTLRLNATQSLSVRAIGASGSDDFPVIVAREPISSLADLKGKSYAVSRPGAADDTTARHMLSANGIDPSEVNFVAVGAPNLRAQALLGGQIDATTVQISTYVTLRGKPGLKVLAAMDTIRAVVPNSATLNVVTTRTLSAEPEQLQRFTTAVMKTARLFESNKQAWVDALSARRPDLATSDVEYLWDQFPTAWGVNGFLNVPDLQRQADFAYQTTPDLTPLPHLTLADWLDTRFVDADLKSLGLYPGYDDPGRPIP